MYVNSDGSMQCSGSINCLNSIYATNNIEAVGTIQCSSISTLGPNGIQIYNNGVVSASINNTGAIIGTSLNVGGKEVLTTSYNPIYCGGKVLLTGGNVPYVGTSTGRVSYTVQRKSLGVYWVIYTTPYPNNNYTPSVTNADRLYGCSIGNNTSSALLEVVTFVSSTVNGDSPFYFSVF